MGIGSSALDAIKRKAIVGSRGGLALGAGITGVGALAAAARAKSNAKARAHNEGVAQSFLTRGE
jgi:hypothetical protein